MCFPQYSVYGVEFTLMSPQEIALQSVISEVDGLTSPLISEDDKPKICGLNDPRQGPTGAGTTCATCSGGPEECPGHFGHILLSRPVYHVSFMAKIVKVLRCVCFYCSKPFVSRTDDRVVRLLAKTKDNLEMRLAGMAKLCGSEHVCTYVGDKEDGTRKGCGRQQPTYKRNGIHIYVEWNHSTEETEVELHELSAASVYYTFSNIEDDDVRLLGMNPQKSRPEWMILNVLPVPPLSVRPTVNLSGTTTRSQDDLTHGYAAVITVNNELKMALKRESPAKVIWLKWHALQVNVSAIFDNDTPGTSQVCVKSGRPLKSLKERLKGKEGRIRGNLMGKRVDYSARSVITPDPYLAIDEVGVPKSIAQTLTFPDIVTPLNKKRLQLMVDAGRGGYPGANYVWKGKDCIDLTHAAPNAVKLEFGDKVERHLIDGDPVVFNRQPTLHKMSMMGHRVKVMPYSTFRMNLSCTTPYNADFDGDEMNLHVPQSLETMAEVKHLLMTPKQLITPQTNKPVMGIVQDTLTGVFKMTRRDVFIKYFDMMDYLMYISNWEGKMPMPCILKPAKMYTGKQLFSVAIPGKLNMMRTTSNHPDDEDNGPYKWMSPGDTKVLVENGELLAGILCKKTLGTSAGSLLHICTLEMGSKVSARFHRDIQMVVAQWLETEGHSIGIEDCIADYETYAHIRRTIEKAKLDVRDVINESHSGKLQATPGNTLEQTFENTVNRILNEARDKTGDSAKKSLKEHNSLKTMVVSGSKGSNINISQIIACVGQQNVEGKRIPFGYSGRTLPHFHVGDHGPASRGFVENSYLSGLTPSEFFFHAMGGREGLIDTACKTAETGYIQRRLMKAMESIMVRYDGTVRNSAGQMLQISYGYDGLCAESLEFQHLPTVTISEQNFISRFKFDISDREHLSKFLNHSVVQELYLRADAVDEIDNEFLQLTDDREKLQQIFTSGESRVVLPCNFTRLFWNARKAFRLDSRRKQPSDLSPLRVIEKVRDLAERCVVVPGDNEISIQANDSATFIFRCMLRSMLCSRIILEEERMTIEAFDWLLGEIYQRFQLAKVDAGEMVGALAAQSLGEPATQMTLNTFHFAGVSAKNVTLGVPRLKEIINVASSPKAPSLVIFLKGQAALSAAEAQIVACRLEYATLHNIALNAAIFYDPDFTKTVIPEDQEMVSLFAELPDFEKQNLSPWVLRMEMDRRQMVEKKITMEKIAERVYATFGNEFNCVFSDDNASKQVLRLRLLKAVEGENSKILGVNRAAFKDEQLLRRFEDALRSEVQLCGLKTIKKVYLHFPQNEQKKQRFFITESGQFSSVAEWLLETDGTALKQVLADDSVDQRRTYSNDICESLRVLGTEASRAAIERELQSVLQFYGLYVNSRHVTLLCDVMTAKGQLMAITRHGINRQDSSVLMRASFEEALDNFTTAACHNQTDHLTGVSENIMLGKIPRLGTGAFDLALDLEALDKAVVPMRPTIEDLTMVGGAAGKHKKFNSILRSLRPIEMPESTISESFCSSYGESPFYTPRSPSYEPGTPLYEPSSPTATSSTSTRHVFSSTADDKFSLVESMSPYSVKSSSSRYSAEQSSSGLLSSLYSPSSPTISGPSTSFEFRGLKVVPDHLKGRRAALDSTNSSPATSFECRGLSVVPDHLKGRRAAPQWTTLNPGLKDRSSKFTSSTSAMPAPVSLLKTPSYPMYVPSQARMQKPSMYNSSVMKAPSAEASPIRTPIFSATNSRKILSQQQPSVPMYSPTSPSFESNESSSKLLEYTPEKSVEPPRYTSYESQTPGYSSNQAKSLLVYTPTKTVSVPSYASYNPKSLPHYFSNRATKTSTYTPFYEESSPEYSPHQPTGTPRYSYDQTDAQSSAECSSNQATNASTYTPFYAQSSPEYSPPQPTETPRYSYDQTDEQSSAECSSNQATNASTYTPFYAQSSPEYSSNQDSETPRYSYDHTDAQSSAECSSNQTTKAPTYTPYTDITSPVSPYSPNQSPTSPEYSPDQSVMSFETPKSRENSRRLKQQNIATKFIEQ